MELVSIFDGECRTTSPTIAQGVGQPHKAIFRLIREHIDRLEAFGRVRFENATLKTNSGTQPRQIALLNEHQATLLITYMRSTEVVHQFKETLVRRFFELSNQKPVIDVDDPVFMAEMWQKTAAKLEQSNSEKQALVVRVQEKDQVIEGLRPGAAYAAQVEAAPDSISVGEAAQLIGTGRNRLMAFMRRIGWITRYNAPYQEKVEEGLLDTKQGKFQRPDNGLGQSITTRFTGKGLVAIQRLWSEEQAAAKDTLKQLNAPLYPTINL